MKTPSSHLYDLVHSLTKSEKRYLKVQSGLRNKDYIFLMDALIAQPVFDEEKLIAENKEANFIKHLAVNKRYLYELILRSLERFGRKEIKDKVFEKIAAAKVLIQKGLTTQAFNELKKGKELATRFELFDTLPALFEVEKKILSGQYFNNINDLTIDRVFQEEETCLKQLQNTNEYWYLAQQLSLFQMRFQKIQNEKQATQIRQLAEHPKLLDLSLATNFKSKLYYFQANATYQFILGHVEQAYAINNAFLELLETHPKFLQLYAERYLGTLNNMLIDSLVIGKYDILEEGINRLIRIPEMSGFQKIKNIESRIFRQRFLLLINWCLRQQDFTKGVSWIPEIEAGLNKFGKAIEKHHRITFYYLIAYLLFLNQRFDESLRWNNLILNDTKEDVVKEIYYFARILNLLIHFEIGNMSHLESLLSSTPKYLKRRRAIYATEKALFRFLGKMLSRVDKKEKEKLVFDFQKELDTLAANPKEQRVFNYLDLRIFLKNRSK